MVTDNAETFQNNEQWLQNIYQQADVNNLLGKLQITCKFNSLRSLWWGGFYEKMVGIAKNAIYKALGRA